MPYIVLDQALAKAAPVTTLGNPLTGQPGETLDTFRAELGAQLLGRDDATPERLTRWINQGYTDLVTSIELPEFKGSLAIITDIGQPFYQLPYIVYATENVSVVDSINYESGGRPLTKTDRMKYRTLRDESGDPVTYFKEGNMIVVWPTPSAARTLAVDFHIRPVWMTDADDQPIVGIEWHEAILLAAVWKALFGLKEFAAATIAKSEYKNYVADRFDPKAAEDEGRIILSSVPRRRGDLVRERGVSAEDAVS